MHIRQFRSDDAPYLPRIFHAAVHEIGRRHYTAQQVEAWAPAVPEAELYIARSENGRLLLVAADAADEPLAYGDLEPDGHIDHFYCRPDVAGTGVASTLYDAIEAAAAERSIRRLTVEASEPARRFFLKKDFIIVSRRDFSIGDVPIHNYAMEKILRA